MVRIIVLILVLMEDTLRVSVFSTRVYTPGINPCFNGRYSQRAKTYVPLYTSIWGYVQAFRNAFVNTN